MTAPDVTARQNAAAAARALLELRFIVLSGKGGVGKTTVAAALARAAQSRGKRVLIAQTDAAERLAQMLGHPGPLGSTVRTLAPGLDVVNMTAREALHQYGLLVLKYEAVYRALFENRAVRGFLSAIPGLDAYAMLGKAWWHTTEKVDERDASRARRKYDLVILDGPASGHAITMLKIPRAILATMPAGPLAKDARALDTLLGDPGSAAFVIVTRPEELPARETVELVTAARGLEGLSIGPLIVDAMPSSEFDDGSPEAAAMAEVLDRLLPGPTGDERLDDALALAATRRERYRSARGILAQLAAEPALRPLSLIELPALPHSSLGLSDIDRLARHLGGTP